MELPKAYDPKEYEQAVNDAWRDSGYTNPDKLPNLPAGRQTRKKRVPYSIAMPPPNATGILHIGHSVMLAIQDILIRFERMRGRKTLWLPGTDHAAIATQNVVEQELKKGGKTKHDLGREKFLERVDEFVRNSQGTIKKQIERMGASCDWSRERFTLDEGTTSAVNHAFTELYNDGLIYRGTRVVNWCPRCQSTLANDEVEYQERKGKMYCFQYDEGFPLFIATTRPETKFGDTAVAVDPLDPMNNKDIGKTFTANFAGVTRKIKIVGDEAVSVITASGAVGVTPAHSLIDEGIAKRHNLPSIIVIDKNAKMTKEAGPEYEGLHVKKARIKVVGWLRENNLMKKEEDIVHNVPTCYRCGTDIEPLPSKQWFISIDKPTKRLNGKSLKERALQVIEKNEITFVPERFGKVYQQWIENLHDWCISRQIWYGHRIPVWYKQSSSVMPNSFRHPAKILPAPLRGARPGKQVQDDRKMQKEIFIGAKPPKDGWTQDPDTLDTWFSSGLWTFSTLGWPSFAETATKGKPGKENDLANFHPTTVMETGYDIIFFWVARMILMSTYFMKEVPFKTVYLHGLVRDEKGRKMSKSLNNGIDPLAMADKYGADAVRLALVIGTTPGNDQKLSEQKIAGFRNYANKLWNIGRFLHLQKTQVTGDKVQVTKEGTLSDRWIQSRLNTLIEQTTPHIEKYEFSQAGEKIYDFAWHEFADWYLEITKVEGNVALAHETFGTILKLLHPFMPFVTETLWKELGYSKELLMIAAWPKADKTLLDVKAEKEFAAFQERVTAERKEKGKAFSLRESPFLVG